MQIAGDPLALGDFRQVLDLFVRFAQLPVHAIALGKKDVPGTDEHRKDSHPKQLPAAHVQKKSFSRANRRDRYKSCDGAGLGADHEGHHGAGKDEERAAAGIVRKKPDSQQQHATDMQERPRPLQQKDSPVEDEEDHGSEDVEGPLPAADVVRDGLNKEESEIKPPEQRTPSVIPVLEHGPKGAQLQGPTSRRRILVEVARTEERHLYIFNLLVNSG